MKWCKCVWAVSTRKGVKQYFIICIKYNKTKVINHCVWVLCYIFEYNIIFIEKMFIYLPNLLKSAVNGIKLLDGFWERAPLYVYGFIGPAGWFCIKACCCCTPYVGIPYEPLTGDDV